MILTEKELCAMARGSAWCENTARGLVFHRFTAEQREIYPAGGDFYRKTGASSGISLVLETDASSLSFAWSFFQGSSRKFAWFDLLLNGVLVSHQGTSDITQAPEGRFLFELPAGKKQLELVFPCLAGAAIRDVELAGAGFAAPLPEPKKTILFLGDSITQGYDAIYPSFALPNLLSRRLGMGKLCRAIGGECFNPKVPGGDSENISLIYSAYGTNDWSHLSREKLSRNARGYFEALKANYPGIPVFVLLPIWRKNIDEIKPSGTFAEAETLIREAASCHPHVHIQPGRDLLPHLPEFFSDGSLHPNDTGFLLLGRELESALAPLVK